MKWMDINWHVVAVVNLGQPSVSISSWMLNVPKTHPKQSITHVLGPHLCLFNDPGLKVNDQLVAYATRLLAVRLKNYVWSHHRALKAKVQCNFSSAYSPEHTNVLRLINIYLNIDINNQAPNNIVAPFSFTSVCSIRLP